MVFNKTAENIFNIKKEQVVGQRFGPERAGEPNYKILTQTMFPSLAPTVVRHSEAGAYPQVIDISFPGQELRVSTDRLTDMGGRVLGFVKLVQDRTREVELMRSKSEFITIAAHQLRTPLTAVNWIFEGFAKSEVLPKDDLELAKNGLTATRKLLKIVNDLLDVSKIEEGRFGYNFEQTNLVGFISELLKNAQAEAKEYGIKLYFDKGAQQQLMITIFHTADVHFGVENYGKIDPASGIHTRLLDFKHSFQQCVDQAIEQSADLLILSGDAYKTAYPTPTQQKLFMQQLFRTWSLPKADDPPSKFHSDTPGEYDAPEK